MMDISAIIGIVLSFGALVMGFTLEGGSIKALMLVSPFVIVIGGTIGVIIASFGFKDISKAFKALLGSFSNKSTGNPKELIEKITELATLCRKNGLMSLDDAVKDPFFSREEYLLLKEGLILITVQKSIDQIQYVMESDIHAYTVQKQMEISVFEAAGGFAPTMGIIGTVLGLVQVLSGMSSNMSDTGHLMSGIATAFVATLYGVAFANVIFLPFANKLKGILKRQKILKEMMVDGVCMIANGEVSRNIQNKLSLYYQAFHGNIKEYRSGIEN